MRITLIALYCLLLPSGVFAQRPPSDTLPAAGGNLTIVPMRHGTAGIAHGAHMILVDPVREFDDPPFDMPPPPPPDGRATGGALPAPPPPSGPPKPPGPSTLKLYAGMNKPTLILVTDIHDDHLAPEVIAAIRTPATAIVIPAAASAQVKDGITIGNGETTTAGGIQIEAVAMYNLKPDPQFGEVFHTKGRGNGYVITVGGQRLYFAGDTACTPEMKALKNIDIAFLPMNLPFTMSAEDAVECAKAFKPRIVYPYHYMGPDRDGPQRFSEALKGSGIEVRLRDWYLGIPLPPR